MIVTFAERSDITPFYYSVKLFVVNSYIICYSKFGKHT